MPLIPLGPTGDAFACGFGAAAAVLILGGPMALRWQRNRQQFQLTQTELERGINRNRKGQPLWLVSMRQGVMILALGLALMAVGAAAMVYTSDSGSSNSLVAGDEHERSPGSSATLPADPPDNDIAAGPLRLPGFGPPRPDPAVEEWHRMKSINSLGMMSLATGFVLLLLGVVRVGFARVERRYEPAAESL